MRIVSLPLLVALGAGCAHVNRWHGDFYGVATSAQFEDHGGRHVTGIVLYVHRAERLRAIGHDNKYLPTEGFAAVLLKGANRLVDPNPIPTNVELVVTGTLDIAPPLSSRGEPLRAIGTPADAFKPSLRVAKIRQLEPTSSFKSKAL